VSRALDLGYRVDHLIAMQGPFSTELNVALMHQHNIEVLVTKDGGVQGGFAEKVLAAQEVGAQVIVVERPEDVPGCNMDELVSRVAELVKE
jgi:precorrin-6x reductase